MLIWLRMGKVSMFDWFWKMEVCFIVWQTDGNHQIFATNALSIQLYWWIVLSNISTTFSLRSVNWGETLVLSHIFISDKLSKGKMEYILPFSDKSNLKYSKQLAWSCGSNGGAPFPINISRIFSERKTRNKKTYIKMEIPSQGTYNQTPRRMKYFLLEDYFYGCFRDVQTGVTAVGSTHWQESHSDSNLVKIH